jgi:hypothetical protein
MEFPFMKRIYTKSVLEFDKRTGRYEINQQESEWYHVPDDEPMAYCGGAPSGGGGGGTQTTQTVEKADPWEGQQPYLSRGFQEAQRQFLDQAPPDFYPGSTVVPYSPETNLAVQMQTNRAINGSPIQQSGTDQLTQTLRGDYLSNIGDIFYNPMQQQVQNQVISPLMGNSYMNQMEGIYNTSPLGAATNSNVMRNMNGDYLYGGSGFNAALDAAQRQVLPQVNSAFERAGRTGSGLAAEAQTRALGDAFASQYGQERQNQLAAMGMGQAGTNAFAQGIGQARQTQLQAGQLGQQGTQMLMENLGKERDNQIRSMLFAPQMASLDYQDISKLAEVGAQKEQIESEKLAEQIARYDYGQNSRQQQLAKYMNLVQGNYGGSSSGTSTSSLDGGGGGGGSFLGSVGMLAPLLFGGGGGLFGGLLGGLF